MYTLLQRGFFLTKRKAFGNLFNFYRGELYRLLRACLLQRRLGCDGLQPHIRFVRSDELLSALRSAPYYRDFTGGGKHCFGV